MIGGFIKCLLEISQLFHMISFYLIQTVASVRAIIDKKKYRVFFSSSSKLHYEMRMKNKKTNKTEAIISYFLSKCT